MLRYRAPGVLTAAGSVASITALAIVLVANSSGAVRWITAAVGVILVALAAALFVTWGRRSTVAWAEMIALLNSMIESASQEIVIFGGDLSWADGCEESIREAVGRGRDVTVVAQKRTGTEVAKNQEVVLRAGASCFVSPIDTGVRGVAVDASVHEAAALLLVRQASPQRLGDRAMESDQQKRPYKVQLYTGVRDPLLLRFAASIPQLLGPD